MSPWSDLWDLRTSTMQNTREKSQRLMPTPLPRIWWLQVGRIGHLQSVIADSRHWDFDSSPSTYDRYDSNNFMEEMSSKVDFLERPFSHGISYFDLFFFLLLDFVAGKNPLVTDFTEWWNNYGIMTSTQLFTTTVYIWWLRKGSPPKSITQVCEVVKIGVNMNMLCMIEKWRIKHHIDKYTP